jgi:soluble P-type ATPase
MSQEFGDLGKNRKSSEGKHHMITIHRPGRESLEIEFILIDFEGTLAPDCRVHPKAKDKMNLLAKRTKIYVLTTGEKNVVEKVMKKVKAEVVFLIEGEASPQKLELIKRLGQQRTAAIGNGADDAVMIEEASLGICVVGKEGAAGEALRKADVVVTGILDAFDFLLKPLRQKATLGL